MAKSSKKTFLLWTRNCPRSRARKHLKYGKSMDIKISCVVFPVSTNFSQNNSFFCTLMSPTFQLLTYAIKLFWNLFSFFICCFLCVLFLSYLGVLFVKCTNFSKLFKHPFVYLVVRYQNQCHYICFGHYICFFIIIIIKKYLSGSGAVVHWNSFPCRSFVLQLQRTSSAAMKFFAIEWPNVRNRIELL